MKYLLIFCTAFSLLAQAPLPFIQPPAAGYSPASDSTILFWAKADAIAQGNGTAVSTWPASKGNSLINVPGNTELFYTGVQNGLPGVFTSSGQMTNYIPGLSSQPFTIWAVMMQTNVGSLELFWDGVDGSQRAYMAGFNSGGTSFRWYAGTAQDNFAPIPTNKWFTLEMIYNGASSTLKTNGVTCYTADSGTLGLNGLCIFSGFNGAYSMDGWYGEILVQQGAPANESTIAQYLRTRWATW